MSESPFDKFPSVEDIRRRNTECNERGEPKFNPDLQYVHEALKWQEKWQPKIEKLFENRYKLIDFIKERQPEIPLQGFNEVREVYVHWIFDTVLELLEG